MERKKKTNRERESEGWGGGGYFHPGLLKCALDEMIGKSVLQLASCVFFSFFSALLVAFMKKCFVHEP